MNLGLVGLNGKVKSPVEPDWQQQFEEWRELLSKCGQKPNRKRVHSLRVATLRLRAEIDFWLLDQADLDQADRDRADGEARAWKKHAGKLRKALSPVRDTDIHLDMLRKMRTESQWTPDCASEIERLEKWFLEKRASAEKELLDEIEVRGARLERSSKKLQRCLGNQTPWTQSDRIRVMRGLIAALAAEVRDLNADSLHEFRKRAKTARYLADVSAKDDAYAARQAALLKKMQNAAGKWHDLQTLAARAQQALDTSDGFVAQLNALADGALQNALELCPRVMTQLLDPNARDAVSRVTMPPKKPVRRVEAIVVKRDRSYA